MNENLKTQGPAVRAEQLIDIYQARQDVPSPWTVISDQRSAIRSWVAFPVLHCNRTTVITRPAPV